MDEKDFVFTPHAREKLRRLVQSGITEESVIGTVKRPEKVSSGYFGRKIAQSKLTEDLVIGVVYEEWMIVS